jgi:ADP-ribose pyrophosphatase
MATSAGERPFAMSDLDKSSVTLKRRQSVFGNSRFSVYSDHIVDGALEVKDFLVVAPHGQSPDLVTGVVVVPVRGDAIMLLKSYRHPISRHVWELPRGFREEAEEPSDAALRELTEETGLTCPREKLVDLGGFFPEPAVIRARVGLFAATACEDGGVIEDELGIDDRLWYRREEVWRMLQTGEIEDGSSCVALYRYFALGGEAKDK